MDHMVLRGEGGGAGGKCAPSCAECDNFLQMVHRAPFPEIDFSWSRYICRSRNFKGRGGGWGVGVAEMGGSITYSGQNLLGDIQL